jgi:uncharacterized protein (TIGR00369 family)
MTLTPQALEARQEWFRAHWKSRIAFNQLIGIEILDWEPGLVRARVPFADRLSAHSGIFHGGVVATLIDTTGTGAVISGHDFNRGSRLTTVSMNVQYMSVAPGEDLFAEGICTRRGRSLSFARVTVTSTSGKLLAEGMLTVSVSGERTGVARVENGDSGQSQPISSAD